MIDQGGNPLKEDFRGISTILLKRNGLLWKPKLLHNSLKINNF